MKCLLLVSLGMMICALAAQSAPAPPNPVFAQIEDVPGLPRVLLIGDSISMGYTIPVRNLMAGKANVHRPGENCGPTTRGVQKIGKWLGDGKWDVIHFNFGLHDLKYMPEGQHQVPIDEYEKNLRILVEKMKATGARVIWASTTPVPEGDLNPKRLNSDVIAYNAAAKRVMDENKIAIDDLYTLTLPRLAELQRPVNVHFSPQGSKVLAGWVVKSIETELAKPKAE